MEIIRLPLNDLTADPNNAKEHPSWQIEQIKNSIKQFGNLDPIGIWGEDNLIVEGHGRWVALKELGYKEIECIRLDSLSGEERKAYALVHNELTMNSGFIPELLQSTLNEIETIDMSLFGFDLEPNENNEPVEDNFEVELPEEAKAKLGDVYQLGTHRLLCGDATKIDDVEKLMNGSLADLVVTDPPYNMAYEGAGNAKTTRRILNDKMSEADFEKFLYDVYVSYFMEMKDGASIYVFYKELGSGVFMREMRDAGLTYKQELIWVKNQLVLGGSKYQSMYEPCLLGCKGKSIKVWNGKRKQRSVIENVDLMDAVQLKEALLEILHEVETDIIREHKPLKNDLHPTMKPIKLLAKLIRNSSNKGDIVLDLFWGSGSTLIACEQLGRSCYTSELDPRYVDVIIQRWEEFTGKKGVLLNE